MGTLTSVGSLGAEDGEDISHWYGYLRTQAGDQFTVKDEPSQL
jgi:hypothetical protein